MTDAIQTISLIEGMSFEGASPSTILTATAIRREKERQEMIDVALATANLILGGFSGRYDTLEACKHMFTNEEYEQIIRERSENRERSVRQAQIEMLKRRMKR